MLLCEYAFYTRQDVEDYLHILEYLDTFYGQILSFEQEKAEAGLMMSDTSIDHVIESCKSYLLVPKKSSVPATKLPWRNTLSPPISC